MLSSLACVLIYSLTKFVLENGFNPHPSYALSIFATLLLGIGPPGPTKGYAQSTRQSDLSLT